METALLSVFEAEQSNVPPGQPAMGAKPTRRFRWSNTV